ncbi:hypothetical protein BC332_31377 [Capsicum chinense]|uniref:Uncharacterized protein n=2 Tax=Capsicum annuum TaxID=4072 RepID=A0A075VWL1_CAPAN|nr:hypothetical protein [Capsicum annuum]PHT96791.1 hypothetical protein BC332_34273 [Capsicum chinense]QFV19609.1 hypothetical protein [Capsicum annuum var. glabriusculum]AIG89960.1 hypothetical protein [Capsicum annuum]AIG90120.1 hypothetical protein [Capsicum annuum]PHU01590.1 hypothetical protein BC332_31377 [Capsicum chinense]
MKKDLSEIAGWVGPTKKGMGLLGIAWVELGYLVIYKHPHCTLSIYLSPSNQRRPCHRESGSAKTRLGTMLPAFFLWLLLEHKPRNSKPQHKHPLFTSLGVFAREGK